MARWKRMDLRRKVVLLTAVLAVAGLTAGWAAGRRNQAAPAADPEAAAANADSLAAPLPQPTQVFIQRTNAFPEHGNVLVLATLDPKDVARKEADGTRDFVTLGFQDQVVLLRDDGQGGDGAARDGTFTGLGTVDDADLQARSERDRTALANRGNKQALIFMGRTSVGVDKPQAFDFAAFQAGKEVPFGPSVVFLEPEKGNPNPTPTVKPSSSGLTGIFAAGTAPVTLGTNLFQDRVLMIRDLGVVTDPVRTWNPCTGAGNPNGVWTFNHLMTQMANQTVTGLDPAIFVERWLAHWQAPQVINTHTVPARPAVNPAILGPWPKRPDGHIDLAQSPFRLLTIDPRLDLRRTTGGGGGYSLNVNGNFLDAGEARFIFGLVTKSGVVCTNQRFAVIFEYRVPKCECAKVKSWAQQWVDLFNFVPGTAAYNSRLQSLTQQFVLRNSNPTRPNGSALGQLRTNEITLASPWELREFQLTQFPFSFLNETTTSDSLLDMFNATAAQFDPWVGIAGAGLTLGGMFQQAIPPVPLISPTAPNPAFLGSNPFTLSPGFFWGVSAGTVPALSPSGGNNVTNWGRHRASLASCNGCHGRESRPTATVAPFVHVDPSSALPATLSEFLTGVNNLTDPQETAGPGLPLRNFDDLARRELDIQHVAGMSCFGFHPINLDLVATSLQLTGRLPVDLFEGIPVVPPAMRVPVGVDDFRRNLIGEVH